MMDAAGRYRGYLLLSLAFAIAFGGYVLYDRWPRPEPPILIQPTPTETAAPSPTPAPMRVHVAGAVRRPGVYPLSPGSRVVDAVDAAGGLAAGADPSLVKLAAPLHDSQQVYLPWQGTPAPPGPTAAAVPARVAAPAIGGVVNINAASVAELDSLPGIGPTYAARIVAYREEHGPFVDPSEIMRVQGIGQACYETIKDRITTE